MKAEEATEFMDVDKPNNRFKQRAAIFISFLAMLLAITGLGGQNANKETLNNNIQAANAFNFYQAKNIRQTSLILAVDEIELAWAATPGLSAEAKAALAKKLETYKANIARYESEPSTGEGKKELMARARAHEEARDHAIKQDPYFDYAEALLQIAIVLISVSLVAEIIWLAFLGGGLGLVGALLMINGFTLWVAVPGLS
jgi:hypothetical protein